jgi:SAM-dependent methyltransferase
METRMITTQELNDAFLKEYNSDQAVLKYSPGTAGSGINYLVEHEYGRIYDRAVDECRTSSTQPMRLLEYGCGVGMNLFALVARLQRRSLPVEQAWGADFSETLIDTAAREAAALPSDLRRAISFYVARNERLIADLANASGRRTDDLHGSFDLVLGVNTFRYCHRLRNAANCVDDIYRLLRPGGVAVMIDMNDRFPAFRSKLRRPEVTEENYIPSLAEYAAPWEARGFQLLTKTNFCWIPHSAGLRLTTICRTLTPILNATLRSRAMRSLVVAKRPT